MSPLSTVRLNSFHPIIINWCGFYKVQALTDMVVCAVTCISIVMGVNMVCHKYGILTWW